MRRKTIFLYLSLLLILTSCESKIIEQHKEAEENRKESVSEKKTSNTVEPILAMDKVIAAQVKTGDITSLLVEVEPILATDTVIAAQVKTGDITILLDQEEINIIQSSFQNNEWERAKVQMSRLPDCSLKLTIQEANGNKKYLHFHLYLNKSVGVIWLNEGYVSIDSEPLLELFQNKCALNQ